MEPQQSSDEAQVDPASAQQMREVGLSRQLRPTQQAEAEVQLACAALHEELD
jgi:hypothetical protein